MEPCFLSAWNQRIEVHESNWLNCDSNQLKIAIRHINEYGRERGPRGLPRLLPWSELYRRIKWRDRENVCNESRASQRIEIRGNG